MSYLHEFCNPLFRIKLIKVSGYSKCSVCVYNVFSLEVSQNKINSRKLIDLKFKKLTNYTFVRLTELSCASESNDLGETDFATFLTPLMYLENMSRTANYMFCLSVFARIYIL